MSKDLSLGLSENRWMIPCESLPFGKRLHNYCMENHHFTEGKSTISMAIVNSVLYVYQRLYHHISH